MAKAHSSRKRPARRARINTPESKPTVADGESAGPLDFGEILGRFSDALALVETAHSALETALEDEIPSSSGVLTLHRGLEELLGVYTEFDIAIMSLKSGAP